MSQFLVDVAQAGYGKTRRQIMTTAENVAHEKGTLKPGCRISRGWFERFMKRQPQLSLRKGDATANVRMNCVDPEAMSQYIDLLNDVQNVRQSCSNGRQRKRKKLRRKRRECGKREKEGERSTETKS